MIVVTGATGQLGRLVVQGLVRELGPAAAGRVVAAVRDPSGAADLAGLGVAVREADYDRPHTLKTALEGASRVLLVSGSEPGRRVAQHRAVTDAAAAAGAALVYTSILRADRSPLALAADHRASEDYIRSSGVRHTFLRNGWYHENNEAVIRQAPELGAVFGSAGAGRIASAARADFADAAVAVLTGEGHEGRAYELSGDASWGYADLAAEISRVSGRTVVYTDLDAGEHLRLLVGAGLPEAYAALLVDTDRHLGEGWLAHSPGDLRALIGRPTTPLADYVSSV